MHSAYRLRHARRIRAAVRRHLRSDRRLGHLHAHPRGQPRGAAVRVVEDARRWEGAIGAARGQGVSQFQYPEDDGPQDERAHGGRHRIPDARARALRLFDALSRAPSGSSTSWSACRARSSARGGCAGRTVRYAAAVAKLSCLRGISRLSAMVLVAEWRPSSLRQPPTAHGLRWPRAARVGGKERRGGITRTGNSHSGWTDHDRDAEPPA